MLLTFWISKNGAIASSGSDVPFGTVVYISLQVYSSGYFDKEYLEYYSAPETCDISDSRIVCRGSSSGDIWIDISTKLPYYYYYYYYYLSVPMSSSSFTAASSQEFEMDKSKNLKEKLERTKLENVTLQREMDMLEFVKNEILNDFMKSEEKGKTIDSKISELEATNRGAEQLIKVNGDELRRLRAALEKKTKINIENAFE
ncbi:hypothetical protein GCK72_011199 [Caenorhabditis remanei]|uniref:Uncharacterized protein n=1 Tax=Caenorhabditis remanei TaxID=31234 RepID=A0A6A5H806_CAERE|nr:hypothetical protein GCK72_011199 [Caenorhabditis remanei]KAF1762934.1 hypothetical protein GCK72_011199 [Caenorhabditis remanei]